MFSSNLEKKYVLSDFSHRTDDVNMSQTQMLLENKSHCTEPMIISPAFCYSSYRNLFQIKPVYFDEICA